MGFYHRLGISPDPEKDVILNYKIKSLSNLLGGGIISRMKKFIIFLLLIIIAFSSFMRSIGGLWIKTVKPEKGGRMGTTTIVLEWSKISGWWQEKMKNLFKQRKEELQKPKEGLKKSLENDR